MLCPIALHMLFPSDGRNRLPDFGEFYNGSDNFELQTRVRAK